MAKVGDLVRYLNSVGGGRISRIDGNVAYVDEDGFENPVMLRECVVVSEGDTLVPKPSFGPKAKAAPPEDAPAKPAPAAETFVVEETPGGERLNILLAYEAIDLKRLSTTTYDAYLVNDSNYYLYFTYMTRGSDTRQWTLRYHGIVEPGVQVFVGEVAREDLPQMDHVAIQYIAFKQDKAFDPKPPVMVDVKLDVTKFFKLHCFVPNMYFDSPVIAVPIVTDDTPHRQTEINARQLAKAARAQDRDVRCTKQPLAKRPAHKTDEPLVVDLHIDQLVDTTAGLSNADMLNLQIDTFRRVMDDNLKHHGKKIVFIHGKGDGVLRKALLKELNYRYKGHDAQDASFREYGYGATQVRIR